MMDDERRPRRREAPHLAAKLDSADGLMNARAILQQPSSDAPALGLIGRFAC